MEQNNTNELDIISPRRTSVPARPAPNPPADLPARPRKTHLKAKRDVKDEKKEPERRQPESTGEDLQATRVDIPVAIKDADHAREIISRKVTTTGKTPPNLSHRIRENQKAAEILEKEEQTVRPSPQLSELYREEKRSPRAAEGQGQAQPPAPKSNGLFKTFYKAALYILFVLASSAILSYFGIRIANDVFAFVKEEKEISITIPENATVAQVAEIFSDNGAVDYPGVFKLYMKFKNRNSENEIEFVAGDYTFLTNLNYDELIYMVKKKVGVRETIDITIPEGLSIDRIIDIFVKNGVGTEKGFREAVTSCLQYDLNYRFLMELQEQEKAGFKQGRKYALEGYLFPDTYEFYKNSSETAIVTKMLDNFNNRFAQEYYDRCAELGMTVDEIVNLASIVQMETKYESELYTVASLYTNRLNNPTRFPRLECDSTYLYAFPEKRNVVTLEEMKQSDNPYSTYSHDGLPPSAICNPGLDAIAAALYPDATDSNGNAHTYFYMVARSNGYHIFSSTAEEHAAAVARVKAEKAEQTDSTTP